MQSDQIEIDHYTGGTEESLVVLAVKSGITYLIDSAELAIESEEKFWMKSRFPVALFTKARQDVGMWIQKNVTEQILYLYISQTSILQVNYIVKNYAAFKNISLMFLSIQKHLIYSNIL